MRTRVKSARSFGGKKKKIAKKIKSSKKAAIIHKKLNFKYKRFRDILLKKREDILSLVKHQGSDFNLGEVGDELDTANQTFEREMMFELTNGERLILEDIEAALRKIEKEDFGVCESCHKKIPAARLRAMPWARNCVSCQSKTEIQLRV